MTITTLYFSQMIGCDVFFETQQIHGKLRDLIVDAATVRPQVMALRVTFGWEALEIDASCVSIRKKGDKCFISCSQIREPEQKSEKPICIAKHILDKQIVDIDGRKVVRVNDVRLAVLSTGIFIVAVDVGIEGLLRRLSCLRPVERIFSLFQKKVPGDLILWDDVATITPSHEGLRLAKSHEKLSTLHPSDLADILESVDHNSQANFFASLDEKRAAEVLEELESQAQVNVLERMPTDKAAEVLEKMPADEVADILDDLDSEKAEELLSEMAHETSEEVRELMEYPEDEVGSIMTTEYFSFNYRATVGQVIDFLRSVKPDRDSLYYLYVLDDEERLIAIASLRDLVIHDPSTTLEEIMEKSIVILNDNDKFDLLAEIVAKYALLAVPVVDKDKKMKGIVVIDDILRALLKTKSHRAA